MKRILSDGILTECFAGVATACAELCTQAQSPTARGHLKNPP